MSISNRELDSRRVAAVPNGVACAFSIFTERALNAELWDVEGRRYIDFVGGMGALAVGHSHPAILEAVRNQLNHFTHTFFGTAPYEGYVALAERLNAVAPFSGPAKTLLVTTGAEAVENAVKIARYYTGRRGIIVFSGSFHGRTLLTLGMTAQVNPYKEGFGPFPGEIYRVPFPYPYRGITTQDALSALRNLFETELDASEVAAIVIEPVQGEGGFLPASSEFLTALRQICDTHGIVLVADEVQAGFGRTGKLFSIENFDVQPDLIAAAKSLAGGLPLAAVIGRAEIMESVHRGGLGGTYAGNPLACAAALAVLDVLENEGLLARAEAIGARLQAGFERLRIRSNHAEIGEIRRLGAMIGIEFVTDSGSREPATDVTARIITEAAQNGLLLASAGRFHNVIRFLVPLTTSNEILDEAVSILGRSMESVSDLQA
ncbi:4-aminobutyrate--2-oxoglutarate transaminase [Mesorhizobium sp.]|uniref:4-aminobutyrate--2-oxoglutarate transaminase n=1 Tax=Mesorhizobium sp. TaxID=1871066 RepID=UPI001222FFA6|nr:4-aminobutyrate--2-oxoglutarate transaminase [Mesorhizobium sp.]TIO74086.1 MAG: 4-aminobutyrate--2-oxoglutarate transaminase [Mesorhizobium sp.]